ncbi:MAG: hypothetical protein ABSD46_09195 [Bacteroidota bacterium]
MKATAYSAMRGLSIIAMITFLFSYGLDAQVKIHEKVEIAPQTPTNSPGKQYYTDINTDIGGDSIVVSIVATMNYVSGAVISIDPAPVYPAYAEGGMEEGELFFLQGGTSTAIVGVHYHWGDPWNVTYLELVNGGSGFTVGDYSAGCWTYGGCCIVVHVTAVSPTINTCVIVNPERSTILVGDTVNLFFQGDYSADQLFDIELFGRSGLLLAQDGTTSASFTGIKQPIRFIAPSTISSGGGGVLTGSIRQKDTLSRAGKLLSKMSKINPSVKTALQAQDDGESCTPAYVTVIEPIIKLTTQHTILQPLGDSDNKGPKKAKVIDYSNVKSDTVTISVKMPNGDPVPDYPFTLSAYVRPNSGGHDHTDNRPTGKFIHKTDTVNTFSDKTGSDGTAKYKYLCSGFGGVDSLYVKGKTDEDTSTAIILLKMDDFVELTEGDHYVLIGANAGGSLHSKNHYGKTTLINVLNELADTTYSEKSYKLRFNDMSLITGGPFDFHNDWNCPHQNHREGVSVDVSSTAITDDGSNGSITEDQLHEWFKELTQNFTYSIENEVKSAHHYHVTVR